VSDGTGEGPLSRPAATTARGIALLVGAVILGIVLLKATEPPDSLANAEEGSVRSATTAPPPSEPADADATTSTEPEASTSTTEGERGAADALVLVANGANQPGVAGRLSTTVDEGGFETAPPANATVDVSASVVYFAAGFEDAATEVAGLFDPRPTTAPLPDPLPVAAGDLSEADVVVVAGPDLAG